MANHITLPPYDVPVIIFARVVGTNTYFLMPVTITFEDNQYTLKWQQTVDFRILVARPGGKALVEDPFYYKTYDINQVLYEGTYNIPSILETERDTHITYSTGQDYLRALQIPTKANISIPSISIDIEIIGIYKHTYCVNGVNGDDSNNGKDWDNAWKTIGHALTNAEDESIIYVADATYNETNLNPSNKNIYLRGVDHNNANQKPIIDCQDMGRAFVFNSDEEREFIIDNFIIQNGNVSGDTGGAINCSQTSKLTIINCIFRHNSADNGGAISCWGSSHLTINNSIFEYNNSAETGSGGAIHHTTLGSITVTNCLFHHNSAQIGGALYYYGGGTITNCTFSNNNASYRGGAILVRNGYLYVNNCILWGDTAQYYHELYAQGSYTYCTLNYCCVDGDGVNDDVTQEHCIDDDPQFVDPSNNNYHIQNTSPCIDEGNNEYVPSNVNNDLDGNPRIVDGNNDGEKTVDMGAYEYQP